MKILSSEFSMLYLYEYKFISAEIIHTRNKNNTANNYSDYHIPLINGGYGHLANKLHERKYKIIHDHF